MIPAIHWTDALHGGQSGLGLWSEAMGRVCIGGTLVLVVAFLLTRLLGRVQAGVRCWIWRLAFLKLALLFFRLVTIALPVLPASSHDAMRDPAVQTTIGAPERSLPGGTLPTLLPDMGDGTTAGETASEAPGNSRPFDILRGVLAVLWGVGVLVGGIRIARQYREALTLVKSACPITDEAIQTEFLQTSLAMGLPGRPELCVSDLTDVPFFFGLLRPVVILPAAVVTDFSSEERRMMLAHELAHSKRHDLVWSVLTGCIEALFFFHPLVWWGRRELRMVQEICCDELAIQSVAVSAHTYGSVLVRVAAKQTASRQEGLSAVAMAESFYTIERRLREMQTFRVKTGWKRWAPTTVVLLGGIALLPWQLEAQRGAPPQVSGDTRTSASGDTTGSTGSPTGSGDSRARKADGRTVKAGDYTLKIGDLQRSEKSSTKSSGGEGGQSFSSESADGLTSGTLSGSGGTSFGPGGVPRQAFRANLSLGLDIAGRNKEDLLLIDGVENLHGLDDRGRAVRGPEMPTMAIPTLPSLEKEGLTREILNLHTEEGAKSLKTLEGDLMVVRGEVRTVEFDASEVRPGASKQVGQVKVTIDSARETDNGYELAITCETPHFSTPGTAMEQMKRMMRGSKGPEAELIGTNGVSYKAAGSGSGLGGGGVFFPNGGGDNNAGPSTTTTQQNLSFSRFPNGAQPKRLVFHVAEPQGAARRVPFKFTDISLSDKR